MRGRGGGVEVTRLNREGGTNWGHSGVYSRGRLPPGPFPAPVRSVGAEKGCGRARLPASPPVPRHPYTSPPSSGACRAPGAGGAGGSAAGADSRAGGGGAGPGPARWNPDQMYPARQECSASPPGPAAAAAPRPPPPAPHREPPRSPPRRRPPGLRPFPATHGGPGAGRDPERLWGGAGRRVVWGSRCGGW